MTNLNGHIQVPGSAVLPHDRDLEASLNTHAYFADGAQFDVKQSLVRSRGTSVTLRTVDVSNALLLHRGCGTRFLRPFGKTIKEASTGPMDCNPLVQRALISAVRNQVTLQRRHCTVFLQRNGGNYFHFVTEVLASILEWWRHGLFSDARFKDILVPSGRFVGPLVSALGLGLRPREVREGTLLWISRGVAPQRIPAQFTAPDSLARLGMVIRDAFPGPAAGSVLYVRRRRGVIRSVLNEEAVVDALRRAFGRVVIIDPAAMPLGEQVACMAQAKVVVTPHGAQATNLLWANAPSALIEIADVRQDPHEYRELARVVGANHFSVNAREVQVGSVVGYVCDLQSLERACTQVRAL